jgi:hypothetical protein
MTLTFQRLAIIILYTYITAYQYWLWEWLGFPQTLTQLEHPCPLEPDSIVSTEYKSTITCNKKQLHDNNQGPYANQLPYYLIPEIVYVLLFPSPYLSKTR